MTPVLESNFLLPNGTFLVEGFVAAVLFAVLVVWPLVETVVRQQWGYTLGVVVLGPIGGLLWFVVGRRATSAPRSRAATSTSPNVRAASCSRHRRD